MASKRKATRRLRKNTPTARKPARRVTTTRKRKSLPTGMRTLYPAIEPFRKGMLRVSSEHEIYFEESGNPSGKPVVFVHGGPGAGCDIRARRFFNPDTYRIVLFDQRGCGRSKPHASLVDNTTWHLVADMEALRQHLSIDRWQVFGGSWGSTLSLAYAQTHPDRVTEIIVRGIFLLRPWELHWFYQHGASALFPDRFEVYRSAIPVDERQDLIAAFYKRLCGNNRNEMLKAARAWSVWEAATSFIHTNSDMIDKWDSEEFAIAVARIECHYFVNKGFLKHEDQLLHDVEKIRHIPGVIVQGRYDVICPMQTAWELHRAWPEAEFKVVADAGHSAFEVGITHELITATDKFAR
jgi:proline iminopeptidase